jgi:hypothetical protein
VTRRKTSRRGQAGVLIRVFLGRFFENEATAGPTDLRESFFWLIAALAAPGLLFAFHQQFYWNFLTLGPDGAAKLRVYVLFDKTLYLTLTSVAMGLVSVAVWNALIVDRRDAFIIGVLPVGRRVIVAAKLLSLIAYVGALNLGMHVGAALLFGAALGGVQGGAGVWRIVAAHLVAASATGMFMFLSVVAFVSGCLAVVGPRRFARVAAALQVLFVAAITTTLVITPLLARGAVSLGQQGVPTPWLAYMPPIWFLGLYETLAGTSSSLMHQLARSGTFAIGSAALAVAVFYPVACYRVLAKAVAAGGPPTRPWNRLISSMMVDRLAADSGTRAALQFLIATAGRVSRFRLALSAAVGLGFTLLAPVALYWIASGFSRASWVSLLAAPLVVSIPLVAGWRVVIAMPSELPAGWVFRSVPMEGFAGRAAARRVTFALGVLIPVALSVPAWVAVWGMTTAWQFVANTLLAGGILVEAHLWGFAGMPCTRLMAVSDSNLQGRWPFYAIGFVAYALGIPVVEVWTAGHSSAWLVTIGLVAAYCVVRTLSNDAAWVNVVTNNQRGPILLELPMLPRTSRSGTPIPQVMVDRNVPPEIPHA